MQHALPSLKFSRSTAVHDPSGQSSFVSRSPKDTHRCSPSQLELSPLAVAAIFTSSVPVIGSPVSAMVSFPDPVEVNAQPKEKKGSTAGAQAEKPFPCMAVFGVEHGAKPLTNPNVAFLAFAGSIWPAIAKLGSMANSAIATGTERRAFIASPPRVCGAISRKGACLGRNVRPGGRPFGQYVAPALAGASRQIWM